MILHVDVTQEHIDHGEHYFCSTCMLGLAIADAIRSQLGLQVAEAFGKNAKGDVGLSVLTAGPEGERTHCSVEIFKPTKRWDCKTFPLPVEAIDAADYWESLDDVDKPYFRRPKGYVLKPFTFDLEMELP